MQRKRNKVLLTRGKPGITPTENRLTEGIQSFHDTQNTSFTPPLPPPTKLVVSVSVRIEHQERSCDQKKIKSFLIWDTNLFATLLLSFICTILAQPKYGYLAIHNPTLVLWGYHPFLILSMTIGRDIMIQISFMVSKLTAVTAILQRIPQKGKLQKQKEKGFHDPLPLQILSCVVHCKFNSSLNSFVRGSVMASDCKENLKPAGKKAPKLFVPLKSKNLQSWAVMHCRSLHNARPSTGST